MPMTSFRECITCWGSGRYDGAEPRPCPSCKGFGMIEDDGEMDEWDDYEEDGPMDLEDQLESALNRAFP